jgi:hypothetical protein
VFLGVNKISKHWHKEDDIENNNAITVAFDTDIFSVATVVYIQPTVTAIPNEWFVTSALYIVKQYWTSSLTIVSSLPCPAYSSETHLTTDNATVRIIPFIITDSTPAKRRMKYFNSPWFVGLCICQSNL